ncbi:MAG TPA: twin-arginine translocase subunit TatC [Gemmataceae bacterium]|nr:twin-arginine translocase subunit TatC [Gemmataceae bacterium]
MLGNNQYPDPEDMFADTRMSFGDHLEELRQHLWRAIYGFGVALIFSFFIGKPVLAFIARPVEEQLDKFYDKRVARVEEELKSGKRELEEVDRPRETEEQFKRSALLKGLGLPVPDNGDDPDADWITVPVRIKPLSQAILLSSAEKLVGRRPRLTTLSAQEAFMVYFKVCLVCGVVIGSPWIFWQIWLFVAAGLYPHEKRLVHVYLPFSLGLFLAGVFLCEFFVIPKALEALLWFNEWIGLEPDLRLNEWLGFAILMPLVFGVSFQTPLVMYLLERIGVMSIDAYRSKRRIAWFLMAIFAAVITPSVDAVSMLFLWVPLGFLYELGIFLCWMSPRPPALDIDVPDSEEMIEV